MTTVLVRPRTLVKSRSATDLAQSSNPERSSSAPSVQTASTPPQPSPLTTPQLPPPPYSPPTVPLSPVLTAPVYTPPPSVNPLAFSNIDPSLVPSAPAQEIIQFDEPVKVYPSLEQAQAYAVEEPVSPPVAGETLAESQGLSQIVETVAHEESKPSAVDKPQDKKVYLAVCVAGGTAQAGAYEGELVNHERNGKGRLVLADGTVLDGQWKNGELDGFATVERTDGVKYEGEWKGGKKHGAGTETDRDGGVWKSTWNLDVGATQGTYTRDGRVYAQRWRDYTNKVWTPAPGTILGSQSTKGQNCFLRMALRATERFCCAAQ